MPLPLCYYTRVQNVGDQASIVVCQHISGKEVAYSSTSTPHILGIGSMMAIANRYSYVWGTGIMHPSMLPGEINGQQIYAVRGRRTADELIKNGVQLNQISFGDPGILLPRCLDPDAGNKTKKYRLGIIPHYVDRFHPFVLKHQNNPEVCILNVHESPEAFMKALSQCESVASSSLHGLIFAIALHIPCVWIKLTDQIAGKGWKYADFFTTIDNPQNKALKVTEKTKVQAVLQQTEFRQYTENPEHLEDSLKHLVSNHQEVLEQTFRNRIFAFNFSTKVKPPKPAIVISYNRSQILQKCCESLIKTDPSIQLYIHDNGSDDPETLKTLEKLKSEGIQVFHRGKIDNADDLNLVDETVQEVVAKYAEPPRYLVTDCDIDIANCPPDTFDVYEKFLDAFPKAECVGPMLTISDLPVTYPLFEHALNRHIDQFWHKEPEKITIDGKEYFWQNAIIDTTLAMHRSAESFRRLKSGIRLYYPYEARHLDWYLSAREMFESTYTKSSSSHIAHWSSEEFVNSWIKTRLATPHFYRVVNRGSHLKAAKSRVSMLKLLARSLVKKFHLKNFKG